MLQHWTKDELASFELQMFQTPSAGTWVLQPSHVKVPHPGHCDVSNPISGEVGAAACSPMRIAAAMRCIVSNPISGEVGAAARQVYHGDSVHAWCVSNPISGEVGAAAACSIVELHYATLASFQTPSAGRWVLQRARRIFRMMSGTPVSNPISGEVGAATGVHRGLPPRSLVSNPISGEVGAATKKEVIGKYNSACMFQTPSAGRWVLQLSDRWEMNGQDIKVSNPISGEVGAVAGDGSQWGCEQRRVSNPISGEVGAAALFFAVPWLMARRFQTPSAGRWVLQLSR